MDHSYENLPYLARVLPPSHPITRRNSVDINPIKFSEWLNDCMDPSNNNFLNNVGEFVAVMERVRLAVQSNLGLSSRERDAHETYQYIMVKSGKPDFPIDNNGEVSANDVIYSSDQLTSLTRHQPRVLIMRDVSGQDGLSLLFKTKFRTFQLHINSEGEVESNLELNWKEIYDDLSPDKPGEHHALRSFTPWQRHSESNFFNGRSTSKVLSYLSKAYPSVFTYDSKSYYRDGQSEILNICSVNAKRISTKQPNIYMTLDDSVIEANDEFSRDPNHPILAVVKRKSPLIGTLVQLVPAIYENGKLHLVIHGHQEETEIHEVFSCDFNSENILNWRWRNGPLKIVAGNQVNKGLPKWPGLHFLKYSQQRDVLQHTSAAPMVRASDAVMRKYWLSGFDIPTVYSEMITIADVFNMENCETDSPLERLEKIYYSDSATSSFRRMSYTEYELANARYLAFQVVVPHDSARDHFYWGEQGENIARTTRMALNVLLKMIPEKFHHKIRFAVNMCCPAASIERMGGGFGLCQQPTYIERIIHAIKDDFPAINIEFKTLMLPDQEQNNRLGERVAIAGADGLVWQGKPRNQEIYDPQAVIDAAKFSFANNNMRSGYSGMVATLSNQQLIDLGYDETDSPHYSVDGILQSVKDAHGGNLPDGFEVMLGRVLLGSPWLLQGRHATDQEILLLALLQSFMLRELAVGAGPCGVDLMQIHVQYNVRHITDDKLRDELMTGVFEARSSTKIIDILYDVYARLNHENDIGAVSLLKPSILKLKTAIDRATSGEYKLYSYRETMLIEGAQTRGLRF